MSIPHSSPSDQPRHPVRVVAQKTGLSSHVLRAWERRYGVVAPTRTEGGQRLYSDADIQRLSLLGTLTSRGGAISQLAGLPLAELIRMSETEPATPAQADGREADRWREAAHQAIEALDGTRLRRELGRAAMNLGVPRFLDEVVTPLLREVGERWHAGRLGISHEHLATAVVREVLGWVRESGETSGSGPVIVVATPVNQLHEGGALLAAATAAAAGWRVTYLGANLPSADIATAAARTGARAVAVSLIHPADDPDIPGHLQALKRALPTDVALMVGGSAAEAYADAIEAAEGEVVSSLPDLRGALRELSGGR